MKQFKWLAALVLGAFLLSLNAVAFALVEPDETFDAAPQGASNQPGYWEDYGLAEYGEVWECTKTDSGDSSNFVVGEAPDGYYWTAIIVKQANTDYFFRHPEAGDELNTGGAYSHYITCKMEEPFTIEDILTVEKTAVTYFERTHEWDIAKKVETEFGFELEDGTPKIWLDGPGSDGDETATWTVDVTYKGYEDGAFNVSGVITIENSAFLHQTDAVISSVMDMLAGTEITVDCPVTFPYTLPSGDTLTCTYSEDGFVEGFNEVTVLAKLDRDGAPVEEFDADAPIVWGVPGEEFFATVNVKDVSDLFDEVVLGSVTEPNDRTFTYDEDFAWEAYKDFCGEGFTYGNTATIVETAQFASATLKVNVRCEELEVSKTVVTYFERTHEWDIAKGVETEYGFELEDGTPKIWLDGPGSEGDEIATWTVDVTYEGYDDGAFTVSGVITIENIGMLPAVITAVDDVLGGTSIEVDCGVAFPYELPVGETLECEYKEDGYFEGFNVVTVTTELDAYSATEPIVWSVPGEEFFATVNVTDVSDLFADKDWSVTAPNGDQFTYTKHFAWEDYKDSCGMGFTYNNTASIVETGQLASAVLKVNLRCEELEVSKTVVTYFERTHEWDIAKGVETEFGYELDGFPKIWLDGPGSDGDETATWTVDVSYEGYEDSGFKVSGEITIVNTGTLDAVITAVDDVLGGIGIDVDCGEIFPYTLEVGDTLACDYEEDGYFEGFNVVTVTTERDEYFADAEIIWGEDPDVEINATVNVTDVSDLFGDVDLGSVMAPNGDTFTYAKGFAWEAYTDFCGEGFTYGNTATIVETAQFASATLKVNVRCEELEVSKTVVTYFEREHEWDIAKKVETEFGSELEDGTPKIWLYTDGSGDETATWTVDVSYEGYEDSGFKVSGVISIESIGTLPAVITAVDDVLGGIGIDVDCGEVFPYTLEVGDTLACDYEEDGYFEGFNVVTVTTERDEYFADAEIIWGEDPDVEINATVNVTDVSDLFGAVDLGMVTAPNGSKFTYGELFEYADYAPGSYQFDNTATIVETGQSASAALKVNVQGFVYETAYAKGDDAVCFIPTFSQWGWTNPIEPGTYTWDLWAGAAQCDTDKGTLVGTVTVVYDGDGYVTVTYNLDAPYTLEVTHVYAGYDMFPQQRRGRRTVDTVAPGQYYNHSPFDGSEVYVIAHAVVGLPDPNFGP